jgi:hypothetical protein
LPAYYLIKESEGQFMMPFRNNNDLHVFAEELLEFLRSIQELDLADQLSHANRFISGSPSEFLNEIHLALRSVLLLKPKALSAEREDEIRQAIRQIDEAFHSNGGADGITEPVSDLDP